MADHNASQPEPVLTRAGIVTSIAILAALCAHLGLPQVGGFLADNADAISAAVLAGGPIVTAVLARRHVTPVASPQTADGAKLTPADPAPAVAVTLPADPDSYSLGMPTEPVT